MTIGELKKQVENIDFGVVIEYIDTHYDFVPTSFKNGNLFNEAGQNNSSCKIFYFAKLNNFTPQETLHLFGNYYRKDVLENPRGTDHQNIRNFIQFGWEGISFYGNALMEK